VQHDSRRRQGHRTNWQSDRARRRLRSAGPEHGLREFARGGRPCGHCAFLSTFGAFCPRVAPHRSRSPRTKNIPLGCLHLSPKEPGPRQSSRRPGGCALLLRSACFCYCNGTATACTYLTLAVRPLVPDL
jgi:hypothetical protein